MIRVTVPRPIHKESFLLQLGLIPLPSTVLHACLCAEDRKETDGKKELKGVYNPYDAATTDKLYKDIKDIISKDFGIACLEVYEQMDKGGKLPTAARDDKKKLPFNTFVRYFYNAHRVSGIKIPSKIEKAYRLIIKGFSDDNDIAYRSGTRVSTVRRIKIMLGYPGYEGKVYDKDFLRSFNNAQIRFRR